MKHTKVDGRVRVLTQDEKDEILEMYLENQRGTHKIATTLHIHEPVVRRYLESKGVMRSKEEMYSARNAHYSIQFTEEQRKDIVKRYKNKTASVYRLRKEFNCSYDPIVRVLKEEGVEEFRDSEEAQLVRRKG